MSLEPLSAEEFATQLIEAELKLKWKIGAAWTCAILASLFGLFGNQFSVTFHVWQNGDWTRLITCVTVFLVFAAGSIYGWRLVSRDRKRLEQLRATASAMSKTAHLGVWPPPLSVPGQ